MDKQKAENLRKLLQVFNEERLNPRDFANAFKSVISYVQAAERNLARQLAEFTRAATDSILQLKRENADQLRAMKAEIQDKLESVKDGYTPVKGLDYFDGEDGEDGKDADEKAIEERIVARFPDIPEPDAAEDIRNKLELLEGDERLDISAINGIEELEKRVTAHKVIPTNQGTGIADSTGNIARFQWLKFPGATITQNADTATISISGSGGLTLLTATGTVNSINAAFTFSTKPTYIVSDGAWYRETKGWTWNSGSSTATLTVPPNYDIWGF